MERREAIKKQIKLLEEVNEKLIALPNFNTEVAAQISQNALAIKDLVQATK